MTKLFLSYAREDAVVAERLARGLERSGQHDVWWDRDLHGGASFGPEIERQLHDCDVVVVIWSNVSVQSPWVRDEAAIGRDASKLLPLSMGEVEPPIGFRQYHVIDIGRLGRASGATIRKIERAIEHFNPLDGGSACPKRTGSSPAARLRIAVAAGALLLIAVAAGGYLWLTQQPPALTVAILPVGGGQAETRADYSRSISADMASFLSAHGNSASVLDPSDANVRNATYRFNVGYSARGSGADATLSLAARGEHGIVWSQGWSVADLSSVDLEKQMSFAASRALLCAVEARTSNTRLSAPLLKLYIVACSRFAGTASLSSDTEVESQLSQIVRRAPEFAAAWQNLAVVRSQIVWTRESEQGAAPPDLRDAALEAIDRARQLTPRSGKIALAEAALIANHDWTQQLPHLDRAVALDPDDAINYAIRSTALLVVGRTNDAVADAQKAAELDPLSPSVAGLQIYVLMCAGRLNEAKEQLAAAYRIWPNNSDFKQADFILSLYYGDVRHAEQLLRKLGHESDPVSEPLQKTIAARETPTRANVEDALDAWRKAAEARPTLTTSYLQALGMFGRTDEALQLLNHPKQKRFVDTSSLFRSEFRAVRSNKRFMAVAAEFGLVRYWNATGNWPDFCSEPGLAYDCKAEAAKYLG